MLEKIKNMFNKKKNTSASESSAGNGESTKTKLTKSYDQLSREFIEKIENPEVVTYHNVDPVFLVLFSLTAAFAFVVSLSATFPYAETTYGDKFHFLWQNLIFTGIGIVFIFFAAVLAKNLNLYGGMTIVATAVTLILLVLVLLFGKEAGGAKRWIDLGFMTIQPSEIAKTSIVLMYALYLSAYHDKVTSNKSKKDSFVYGAIYPTILLAVFVLLVYLEKHNSGMIIIGATGLAVLFIGGVKKRWLALLILIGLIGGIVLLQFSGHGMDRINEWINQSDEVNDDNWQSIQGLYAISSGGLFGLGPGQSRLKYGYVSQPQNDFIFPIICEELGFVGGMAVVLLFLAIFLREMKLARNANNLFASIAISGLAIKMMLQVVLNIFVVTGIIMNTGVSLPLFSAGGSAMVFQFLEFGIVLGLSRYCDVKS